MSQAPAMPLFVDAYIADTTHLSTEEHGAYLLLLMAMWRRGGTVPDDDRDLARMTGLALGRWRRVKERLAVFLCNVDGELSQKRLQKEWKFIEDRRATSAINGALGGRPISRKSNGLDKPRGYFQANLEKSPQSHTHKIEEANASLSETSSDVTELPKRKKRVGYPPDFEAFWKTYPTDELMSKKQAGEVWKRMTEDERQAAFHAIPSFRAYCASKPDYRPVHANRFLSQARYVGFNETADKAAGKVFVPKGTPEWEAWQRVKRVTPVMSAEYRREGWWFPSRWPQRHGAAA